MSNMSDRDARIAAAGLVQSAIASGRPVDEILPTAVYGMRCVKYMAALMQGTKLDKLPTIPTSLKEKPPNG